MRASRGALYMQLKSWVNTDGLEIRGAIVLMRTCSTAWHEKEKLKELVILLNEDTHPFIKKHPNAEKYFM